MEPWHKVVLITSLVLLILTGLIIFGIYLTAPSLLLGPSVTLTPALVTAGSNIGKINVQFRSAQTSESLARLSSRFLGTLSVDKLEFFLSSVTLARSLESSGSGYSNLDGTWDAYSSDESRNYDTFLYDEALANQSQYVNLMDSSAVADKMSVLATLPAETLEFKYVVIQWMRPIGVQLSATNDADGTIYTKAGVEVKETCTEPGVATSCSYQTLCSDMSQAPAEKTIMIMNNGGSWCGLPQSQLLDPSKSYRLLLVYNTSHLFRATISGGSQSMIYDDAGHGLNFTGMTIVPILCETSDQIWRENYVLHYTGETPYDVVIQIYYRLSQPDDILGVLTYIVPDADFADGTPMGFPSVFYITTTEDGRVDLFSFDQTTKIVGGIQRRISDQCSILCYQGQCGENVEASAASRTTLSYDYIDSEIVEG